MALLNTYVYSCMYSLLIAVSDPDLTLSPLLSLLSPPLSSLSSLLSPLSPLSPLVMDTMGMPMSPNLRHVMDRLKQDFRFGGRRRRARFLLGKNGRGVFYIVSWGVIGISLGRGRISEESGWAVAFLTSQWTNLVILWPAGL